MLHVIEEVRLIRIAAIAKLLACFLSKKLENGLELVRVGRRSRRSFTLLPRS